MQDNTLKYYLCSVAVVYSAVAIMSVNQYKSKHEDLSNECMKLKKVIDCKAIQENCNLSLTNLRATVADISGLISGSDKLIICRDLVNEGKQGSECNSIVDKLLQSYDKFEKETELFNQKCALSIGNCAGYYQYEDLREYKDKASSAWTEVRNICAYDPFVSVTGYLLYGLSCEPSCDFS